MGVSAEGKGGDQVVILPGSQGDPVGVVQVV